MGLYVGSDSDVLRPAMTLVYFIGACLLLLAVAQFSVISPIISQTLNQDARIEDNSGD